jgi:predicted homoserine dehydrogenase-like protein
MVASYADGTKISFEQAIVANATGMRVAKRGMIGPKVPPGTPITEAVKLFPIDELNKEHGIVDYVVGAEPAAGIFIIGRHDNPIQQNYLNYYKLGDGPFYCLYTPYHLCHFEVHNTIARAVLFRDAAVTPLGKPFVDVITAAKKDLEKGQVIDGIGGYMTYGVCENSEIVYAQRLLPIGLAEGCKLKKNIKKNGVLTYNDVEIPNDRLTDTLREEQDNHFHSVPDH